MSRTPSGKWSRRWPARAASPPSPARSAPATPPPPEAESVNTHDLALLTEYLVENKSENHFNCKEKKNKN